MDTINTVFPEGLLIVMRGYLVLIGNVFHNSLLQALEEAKFDLSTVFLVVQEMLTHFPKIVTYISSTGPLQEFQHYVGRESTSVLMPLFDIG